MYVIGGQVDVNSQITNDVLVMPVSETAFKLEPCADVSPVEHDQPYL